MSTFVDTNFFLKFLLQDNEKQTNQVKDLFLQASEGELKLSSTTIVFFELYWVLSTQYQVDFEDVVKILKKILSMGFIYFEERRVLTKAIEILIEKPSLQLEDCYNVAWFRDHKLDTFATFDKKLLAYIGKH